MNVSSSSRILWCLKSSFLQKQSLTQFLGAHHRLILPSTRLVHLTQCQKDGTSTLNRKMIVVKDSIWKKAFKFVKYYLLDKAILKTKAYYLYETVADRINYLQFIEDMELPDTFNSWFLITELHVWMLMAKSMELGENGRTISYYLVESMWKDVDMKSKQLGQQHASTARNQIQLLGDQFQGAIVGYDEGLLSDDKVLASALWRRFFNMECNNPKNLETMVKYVRQQMHYLDNVTEEQLSAREINWIPLVKIV